MADSVSSELGKSPSINNTLQSNLSEVTVPQILRELNKDLEQYRPQVEIIYPQQGETLKSANLKIEVRVADFPLFKDEQLKLGNHLNVIVDNEAPIAIYDLQQPISINNLTPGTHTIRAFAVKPWSESFKNEDAYAQVTCNVLTETNYYPDRNSPLLTYNSPTGTFGAEPIMLDFYLNHPKSVPGEEKLFKSL